MEPDRPSPSSRPDGIASLGPYPALVLLGAVPILVLAVFAYLVSARAVDDLVDRGNVAAGVITAALVEREFEHWMATLTSHAGFPALSAAVAAGDVPEVRRRLEVFVTAHSGLDRAFVTDTTGLLWVDFPEAPESLGRRFDDRDWYAGVSGSLSTYVSEVYQRHAEPRIQVVSVAAPVRSPDSGEVAGFLVAQVRLDTLSELLDRVEVGHEGTVLLRDHTGVLVAHPGFDPRQRPNRGYAEVLPAVAEGEDEMARGRFLDPFTERMVLASAVRARVGDHDWTVISQQPQEAALAPVRTLALRLGVAGLLMGGLTGVLLWSVVRENHRRREAEAELVAANEDLERRVEERTAALMEKEDQLRQVQKMEAVGRLAGGVAHDFNNILTVVLGSTDLLLDRLAEDAAERSEIEEVRQAAERATDLTRQLLAFSRKQVMQPRILDVNESMEGMRGLLERVLGEHIEMVWNLSPGLHPVRFDPGQIEQVILNLAVNARDAMPRGGKLIIETGNVELDEDYAREHLEARPGPHVVLAVTDTGSGMDAETRQRVFEPFYTTKRLGQGTGLGLSTVYGIVRQGGGHIWVYSEPERGTTFKVYLPRAEGEPWTQPAETRPVEETEGGTVLVVEDDPSVRSLVVQVLRDAGYEVLEAPDAQAAAAAFGGREGGVDLLLTDVVLPGTGGPDLVARLDPNGTGLRVLYMSGFTDTALVHHGVTDERAVFIEKPLRPRALLEKVREALGRPLDDEEPRSARRRQ